MKSKLHSGWRSKIGGVATGGIDRFVAGNIILPFYDLVRGTSRYRFGKVLDKTQWLSASQIETIQLRNLRKLLNHAYYSVPFYREAFKRSNIRPSDIKVKADLCKLPILTKEDLRKNFHAMVSTKYPRKKLVRYRSGGTGSQVSFYITKEQMSWEIAAEFRAYGWAGYERGDRCMMLWGSPVDMSRQVGFVRSLANDIERVLLLNTYVLSDEVLRYYSHLMEKFKPEIIRGYASSVFMLARFLSSNAVKFRSPRAVITSAETLLPHYRKTIETSFACQVFDYYGSREIGGIAAECEEHSGYHMSAENVVTEFVRENESVEEEPGLVLVTSLRNYGMPLTRYAIGDVGKPSSENCSCGRGLPLISSIEGRVSQFMAVRDKETGSVVPVSTAAPGLFSQILMKVPVENYRIIQENLDKIVIEAVKGKGYSQSHSDFIVNSVRKYLKSNISVEFDFVDEIPPLPSGKRSVFVSRINAFEKS